jgi:hypothetical protein
MSSRTVQCVRVARAAGLRSTINNIRVSFHGDHFTRTCSKVTLVVVVMMRVVAWIGSTSRTTYIHGDHRSTAQRDALLCGHGLALVVRGPALPVSIRLPQPCRVSEATALRLSPRGAAVAAVQGYMDNVVQSTEEPRCATIRTKVLFGFCRAGGDSTRGCYVPS